MLVCPKCGGKDFNAWVSFYVRIDDGMDTYDTIYEGDIDETRPITCRACKYSDNIEKFEIKRKLDEEIIKILSKVQ